MPSDMSQDISTASDLWRSGMKMTTPVDRRPRKKELKGFTDREIDLPADSELISSFDPMKNLHLWTMWRTAVNGRIADENRSLRPDDFKEWPFGRALTQVPLNRFIRIEDSLDRPEKMTRYLGTHQFVFFGVPRVSLRRGSYSSK